MSATVISTVQDPVKLGEARKKEYILRKSLEWENSVKAQVRAAGLIDTGNLVNSYFTEILEDGFLGISSTSHAKYVEFGAEPHWVPFFYYGDTSKPVLAKWAKRVLGKTTEEMLAQGGMVVKMKEWAPMRNALVKL